MRQVHGFAIHASTGGKHSIAVHDNEKPLPYQPDDVVRFIAISDTHTQHALLTMIPQGDVLIHAGDFSNTGTLTEVLSFCEFMKTLPHPKKYLCPGNHDLPCDATWYEKNFPSWHDEMVSPAAVAQMLSEAGVEVLGGTEVKTLLGGLTLFGSSAQPRQPKGRPQMAFGRTRGKALKEEWDRLPYGLDVLVTHTPPSQMLDMDINGKHLGCEELLIAVKRTRPLVHVFGHVHAGYGVKSDKHTTFVNAACARDRRGAGGSLNAPFVFDIGTVRPRTKECASEGGNDGACGGAHCARGARVAATADSELQRSKQTSLTKLPVLALRTHKSRQKHAVDTLQPKHTVGVTLQVTLMHPDGTRPLIEWRMFITPRYEGSLYV